jgi:hypothetical protein
VSSWIVLRLLRADRWKLGPSEADHLAYIRRFLLGIEGVEEEPAKA